MEYKLKHPIDDLDTIDVKSLLADDLKGFSAKPKLAEIVSCILPDSKIFDEMDGEDISNLSELVGEQLDKEVESYRNDEGLVTIKLEDEIRSGKDMISEISFRRIKGKDLKKLSGEPSFIDLIRIGGKLAGLSYSEVSKVKAYEGIKIVEIVSDFL